MIAPNLLDPFALPIMLRIRTAHHGDLRTPGGRVQPESREMCRVAGAVRHLSSAILTVGAGNERALRLYELTGYRMQSERDGVHTRVAPSAERSILRPRQWVLAKAL